MNMSELESYILPLFFVVAIVFTLIGFVVGYIIGRKSKNTLIFTLKFTSLQMAGIVLFILYNRWLSDNPAEMVNLGILSLVGGEAVGMMFTRGVSKSLEKK